MARVPQFIVGVVGVPVILYAMFGLPQAGERMPGGSDVGAMLLASFAGYGVVSQAIFVFGGDVASERGSGWLRRLRATPMPMWAYFGAKVVAALAFTVMILVAILALARIAGGVELTPGQTLRLLLLMLAGTVGFSTLGFAIAYWFTPKAANAVANLLFLPLSFASGFFTPLSSLPKFLQDTAPYLPTYHYGQLLWAQAGAAEDVSRFGVADTGSATGHALWVIAAFVVFGVLTAVGYRRDLERERG